MMHPSSARRPWRSSAAAVLGLTLLAGAGASAHAQGFGLNEIGTCGVARAGAGAAAPCDDASRIYWNPATAVRQRETVSLLGGAAAIQLGGAFTQDTTGVRYPGDIPLEVPPHLFANYRVYPRMAVGLGVYVPYGLTSQWEGNFPGRFSALRASLASVYVQPNFAFDVVPGRFAIGGGPVVGISSVELVQALDLAATATGVVVDGQQISFGQLGVPPGVEFGRATLEGHSLAWGFNVGAHWQVTDAVSIGGRYLSEMTFDYHDAEATFAQTRTGLRVGGTIPGTPIVAGLPVDDLLAVRAFGPGAPLTTRGVRTSIAHPAQAQVGIGIAALERTTFNLDYAWVGWSAFEELAAEFLPNGSATAPPDLTLIEDYEDSWAVRGSVDHRFGDGWTAYLGSSYIRSPAPDVTVTPLLPDMDRYNFAGGLTVPFGDRYALDVAYLRVETTGRRGRVVERESRAQTAAQLNGGWYELDAHVLSLSLKATW